MASSMLKSTIPGHKPSLIFGQPAINTADQIFFIGGPNGQMLSIPFSVAGILASAALTGTPTTPDPGANDSSQQVTNTGWVQRLLAAFAPLASPKFTGLPVAPTVGANDGSTSLATTFYADRAATGAVSAAAKLISGLPVGGRLSVGAAGVAVTEQDVVGATTVRLVPLNGDFTVSFDGTKFNPVEFAETTLVLDTAGHLANTLYPVFEYLVNGVVTLGTGPAWTGNTSTGTGPGTSELATVLGRLVNKNPISLRNNGNASPSPIPVSQALYRGLIRTTAAGQTEDSALRRRVSNVYNPSTRPMIVRETAASWGYSATAWRQANGNGANQVDYCHAVSGRSVSAKVFGVYQNSSPTYVVAMNGIGLDGASSDISTLRPVGFANSSDYCQTTSTFDGFPGVGAHALEWLEYGGQQSGITDTQTWYGTNNYFKSGLAATIDN